MVYYPAGDEFQVIEGLELKGFCRGRILSVQESFEQTSGPTPHIWMRGLIETEDAEGNCLGLIQLSFTTPYPLELPRAWRISDFISWIVTHEMMESIKFQGRPLFHSDRLIQDHDPWAGEPKTFKSRLDIVRQRYERDLHTGRWVMDGQLTSPLSLEPFKL